MSYVRACARVCVYNCLINIYKTIGYIVLKKHMGVISCLLGGMRSLSARPPCYYYYYYYYYYHYYYHYYHYHYYYIGFCLYHIIVTIEIIISIVLSLSMLIKHPCCFGNSNYVFNLYPSSI